VSQGATACPSGTCTPADPAERDGPGPRERSRRPAEGKLPRPGGRRQLTDLAGAGHVSIAGLACYQPGYRSRLHHYRGRKGETKAFTWVEYRDLLIAAHHQLPGGAIVLIWDNLNVHLRAELRASPAPRPGCGSAFSLAASG
jgi:hypothetical protein